MTIEGRFLENVMNLNIPGAKILEVHLTPRNTVNKTRKPSSVLDQPNDLGLPLLRQAVRDAADLGYNFLHIAGANCVRHPGLPALCREAHGLGMPTSLITRNLALTARQLEWLRFSIDLLGVEIEAKPAARNGFWRAPQPTSRRPTQTMGQQLGALRDSGIPFALVFCLTKDNLAELEGAAELAVAQGAAMLHVQTSPELTADETTTAWMTVQGMRERPFGKLVIHLDTVNRYSLPTEPEDVELWRQNLEREAWHLSELVSPLVIEDDGTVTPLRYGFPRRYAFGKLQEERLAAMTKWWIEAQAFSFCNLYTRVLSNAGKPDCLFGDFYGMLAAEAQQVGGLMSAAG